MNAIIEKLTGLNKLSDQVIATDLLVSSKCGITQYSVAITETTSEELRNTLVNQLNDIIAAHEQLAEFMMEKGYYHAYDLEEQYQVDMNTTDTALGLKELLKK